MSPFQPGQRGAGAPHLTSVGGEPRGEVEKGSVPTREVDLHTFVSAQQSGALVIDVREPHEYVGGHVPGARLMPLNQLHRHAADLPRDIPVYVICASGNRSGTAAEYLTRAGVDAWSVAGGTSAWLRAGGPLVLGTHPAA